MNQLFSRSILNAAFSVDDHSDGSVVIRASDNKILVAASTHSATNNTYYISVSNNALDPTAFATAVNIGPQYTGSGIATSYAYANLFQLPAEGNTLYNFFRANYDSPSTDLTTHYSTSSDGGTTWAQATQLLWAGRPYFRGIQNGSGRIDCIVSDGNPTDGIFPYNNIYHFYYQGGHWYTSSGVDMGSPPFTQSQPTKIYDSQGSGLLAWHWDVKLDPNTGYPVVGYVVFNTQTDHEYYQARWNGSNWASTLVCAGGGSLYNANSPSPAEPYYSGGFCIDPTNMDVIYASRQVDVNGNISINGVHQLFKFTTNDGINWQNQGQLTSGTFPSFRPRIIQGSRKLFYVNGLYNAYSGFGNYVTNIESIDLSEQLVGADGRLLVGADGYKLIGNI